MGLKLLWRNPTVQFKGKGIMQAWQEEMERRGWESTDNLDMADCVVFGSDSQLAPELIGSKPTLVIHWGWLPERLLDPAFRQFAEGRLALMSRCTRILVPGPCTQEQLCHLGLPSQVCLPGVDGRSLDQRRAGPRERRVIFIGRIDAPHKNLAMLIRALGLIKPSPPLLVVGPGNRGPFQDLASRRGVSITFTELNDAQKATELAKSAVLAHPSSYEGFGLPPLEALYCGTPAIVQATPHMLWLTRCRAYFVADEGQLAQTIIHILENPQAAKGMAAGGQQQVKAFATLEKAAQRLSYHIHQVIKDHLGRELREKPQNWARVYDDEHRRNWESDADNFDPTWARHWRAQTLIGLLKECGAKEILDAGCGAVYPTIFARAGFKVTALDISEECRKQVITVAQKWKVEKKITAVKGDARALAFPDNNFDAVVQGEIWEHVPEPRKVIEEGLRVLKPGGYLIATTPIGHSHWDPMHMGPVEGGWDDTTLRELLEPWEGQVKRLETIAEKGTEPSYYLVVLEKKGEVSAVV